MMAESSWAGVCSEGYCVVYQLMHLCMFSLFYVFIFCEGIFVEVIFIISYLRQCLILCLWTHDCSVES